MGLQDDPRLHDVQIVNLGPVNAGQDLGEEIRLLLVVAFEADPIAGPDDGFKKRLGLFRRDHFATGVARSRFDAGRSLAALLLPFCHIGLRQQIIACRRGRIR